MENQVDQKIKEQRNEELLKAIDIIAEKKGEALLGKRVQVLIEGPSKNNLSRLVGRTRTNKIVIFEGEENLRGRLVDIKINESTGFTLYGEINF